MSAADKRDNSRYTLPLVFIIVAAALIARAIFAASTTPLFQDTDDAMRMVVVHDFLNGQSWYDHLQYRLNTPFGGDIHWSRLVDVPIALLSLLIGPFAGAMTDTVVGYVYPLLLLLVLMALMGKLTECLVGREGLLAGMLLPVFSPSLIAEFSPGRMDHHSIQVLLSISLAWCTIMALKRPRFAIGAGLVAATSLAIGTEAIAIIAAAILAFGLNWVIVPNRGPVLRLFGLSFAIATALHLALYLPPERWLDPACDALSIVYVLAAIGVGLCFTVLSLLPLNGWWTRLLVACVLGVALLAGLLIAYPTCLKGPYGALDPWLVAHWLDRIAEARPLHADLATLAPFAVGLAVPLLLAVITFVVILRRTTDRGPWLMLALFLAAAIAVTLLQNRGGRLAVAFAIPALAWLIASARQRYLKRVSITSVIGLLAAWLGSAGLVSAVVLGAIGIELGLDKNAPPANAKPAPGREACLMPDLFADLAGLPPERIMTPIDLGAHMLLYTPHAVVSAPYHRNQQAVRETFDFFNIPLDNARKILEARGVSLIVTCPYMIEMKGLEPAPDSFIARFDAGTLPEWLVDQSLPDNPLRIFAVLPRP